ncbi:MAG: alpha/beta fold hydrolase, partial [Geobacter sp.]|nr:alpha/beta fold hydrolase [Geobacter sp.]
MAGWMSLSMAIGQKVTKLWRGPMLAGSDKTPLHYEAAGEGVPLVLIHGFPLSGSIWQHQLAGLADCCRVIVPDLRGFGRSAASPEVCTMDSYADDLVQLLDSLGIDRAVFCGMSMGGYVVFNLLERYPERVLGLCLMVTRGGAEDEAGKLRRSVLAEEVLKSGAGAAADIFSTSLFAPVTIMGNPTLVESVRLLMLAADPAGLANALLAMRDRADYSRRLGEFSQPALVVGAADDMAIPPEESRLLAAGLGNARLCIVP